MLVAERDSRRADFSEAPWHPRSPWQVAAGHCAGSQPVSVLARCPGATASRPTTALSASAAGSPRLCRSRWLPAHPGVLSQSPACDHYVQGSVPAELRVYLSTSSTRPAPFGFGRRSRVVGQLLPPPVGPLGDRPYGRDGHVRAASATPTGPTPAPTHTLGGPRIGHPASSCSCRPLRVAWQRPRRGRKGGY